MPVVINSVQHWNSTLREAKKNDRAIVVDFFAKWCGPCKTIAPTYEQLALQHPSAVFIKVDVDQHKAIAKKYQISSMPTFVVINKTGVVGSVRGADPSALTALVKEHAPAQSGSSKLPEDYKAEGNAAFAAGKYAEAIEHYSRAIQVDSRSAELYGNRASAYIKLIKSSETPKKKRQAMRPKAIQDAEHATTFGETGATGWIAMAEALILAGDEEGMESVAKGNRAEGKIATLAGAKEAIENAIGLSNGSVRADAQRILAEIETKLQAL